MSHDVETLVRRALAERAAAVGSPGHALADAARGRARAHRRNQVVGAAVAAVVVAVAAVVPLALTGGGRARDGLPTKGTRVTLAVPERLVTRVVHTELAPGAEPTIGYASGRVLHLPHGGTLGLPVGPVAAVESPHGGAFVSTGTAGRLQVVDSTGHTVSTRSLSWPVRGLQEQLGYVDREGSRFVTELPSGGDGAVEIPDELRNARPVGWLGEDAVVLNVPGRAARLLRTDGTVELLGGMAEATATDGAALVASRSADRSCMEVRRRTVPLWRSCNNVSGFSSVVDFSPDGQHALVRRQTVAGGAEYAVVVAESGEVLRLFSVPTTPESARRGIGQAVFEHDAAVLLAVFQGQDEAVVRCSLAGACEVAVPGGDLPDGEQGPEPFDPAWVP